MEEKSYEEFRTFLAYRNDWSLKCDMYLMEIRELQEKIDRLTRAGQKITSSAADVRELMSRLQILPEKCSEWIGYQAEECFRQCDGGELYIAYDEYSSRLDSVLKSIDYTRNRLSIQLEEINSNYLEARSNYVCWANRTAYYWK